MYQISFVETEEQLKQVLEKCINAHGATGTAETMDNIKALGYKYSTRAAMTVSISDMTVPKAKKTILELCKKGHPGKAIYFVWQCVFRLAGYKLGRNYERLPWKMVLRCTMSPGYWKD